MRNVRTGQAVPIKPSARLDVGRRLRAARMLADVSVRDAAAAAGLTFTHVAAIERGTEPLTATDARDLGAALGCPSDWLRDGWS
jgi:transcriptional regulator with XRE-family HTH domain